MTIVNFEHPYSIEQSEKEKILLNQLLHLVDLHKRLCPYYAKVVNLFSPPPYTRINEIPYLPINLFKTTELKSIESDKIFKILSSSGTTGSEVSKIYLDRQTSQYLTQALFSILSNFLGKQRLPMLIIDHDQVITDPKSFSARGAALVGLMNFGRDYCYALDQNLNYQNDKVKKWLSEHTREPIFIFGLTYLVWGAFLKMIKDEKLSLDESILIHSGGWKKLEEVAVDATTFKKCVQEKTGISRCYNFYGMVEQVGGIYMECDQGVFHTPSFSDIIIRDPITWRECKEGTTGVIQSLSVLPHSYPGHSVLTEDLGYLVSIDKCPCGRKGKTFKVIGRVPRAHLRGCSDTLVFSERGSR